MVILAISLVETGVGSTTAAETTAGLYSTTTRLASPVGSVAGLVAISGATSEMGIEAGWVATSVTMSVPMTGDG